MSLLRQTMPEASTRPPAPARGRSRAKGKAEGAISLLFPVIARAIFPKQSPSWQALFGQTVRELASLKICLATPRHSGGEF